MIIVTFMITNDLKLGVIVALLIAFATFFYIEVVDAPRGWQDKNGFHTEDKDVS